MGEVIDRTQEKINYLNSLRVVDMENYFSIEDDSFELPIVSSSKSVASKKTQVLNDVLSHLDKLMVEGAKTQKEETKKGKDSKTKADTKVNEKKKSTQDVKSKTVAECKKDKEVKKVEKKEVKKEEEKKEVVKKEEVKKEIEKS